MIPFTVDQFLEVFERYNSAVWPAQLFLYAVGIFAICMALQRKADFSKVVSLILAALWIWMGLVYHLRFFSVINNAADLRRILRVARNTVLHRRGFAE